MSVGRCWRLELDVCAGGGGRAEFPANAGGRFQLEQSFPPKRAGEFNLNVKSCLRIEEIQ